jgi:putative ABC transport system permease protein
VSVEQAQAEMSGIARNIDAQLPAAERNRGISVVPLSRQLTGARARFALWMLAGAVFCVLLIAVSNVAALSLARSARRGREIAIRTALGASRGRIVRQLLAENLTLATAAGLLAVWVADAMLRLIAAFRPAGLVRMNEAGMDPGVLGAALAFCLLTGILVGIAPAITASRRELRPSVRGRGPAHVRVGRALVAAEFALAILLLTGAGLLTRSLRAVENVEPGFLPEHVLSVQLSATALPGAAQRTASYGRIVEQVEAVAGVERAGIIENFFTRAGAEQAVMAEGGSPAAQMRLRDDAVSAGFFQAVRTPLIAGRFFTAQDGPDTPRVAIVNEALARRLWPGQDATDKRFRIGEGPWLTVAGVVGNMRRQGLENEPGAQLFVPLAQDPPRLATLLVRTSSDHPLRLLGAVQAAVHQVDPHLPVYGGASLESQLGSFAAARRFQTSLLAWFSAAAMLLAAIGIYGLIQYSVTARTHEIGIRIAVGARSGDVFRQVMGDGLKLCATGLTVGLGGALWVARAGSSLLFGVTAADPVTFVTVPLLLVGVALAACYFPARRAMKIEPVAALRRE